jgi:hypothetical protein
MTTLTTSRTPPASRALTPTQRAAQLLLLQMASPSSRLRLARCRQHLLPRQVPQASRAAQAATRLAPPALLAPASTELVQTVARLAAMAPTMPRLPRSLRSSVPLPMLVMMRPCCSASLSLSSALCCSSRHKNCLAKTGQNLHHPRGRKSAHLRQLITFTTLIACGRNTALR